MGEHPRGTHSNATYLLISPAPVFSLLVQLCTRFVSIPPAAGKKEPTTKGKGRGIRVAIPGGAGSRGKGGSGSGSGGTCILFSGGFGGLVRCSVVPPHVSVQRMPSSTRYNFSVGRKAVSKVNAASAAAAAKGSAPAAGKVGAGLVAGVRLDPVSGRIVPASTASGGGSRRVAGRAAAAATPGVATIPETPGGNGGDQAAAEGGGGNDGSTVPGVAAFATSDVVSRFGPAGTAALAAVSPLPPPGAAIAGEGGHGPGGPGSAVAGNGSEPTGHGPVSVSSGAAGNGSGTA